MSSFAVSVRRPVLADLVPGARVRDAVLVVAGAGLVGVSAQVSIHTSMSPVPFTLQTLAVLLTGAALGSVRAVLSMLLYLVAGAAGVPWFTSHTSGWGGPSFGYIVGFIAACAVVGWLAGRRADRNVITMALVMVLGNVVIYLVGATWLATDLHLSAAQAWHLGVRPFLVSDLFKIALGAVALPATWKVVRR